MANQSMSLQLSLSYLKPLEKNRVKLRLNGTRLIESKKIKYLCLIVDDRLTWKFHIHELSKKLSRIIGILYFALFQSQISYGLMAWGTACNDLIEKLFLLQKRAVRIISDVGFNDHTQPLFKKLSILNIRDVLKHQIASFMYDFDSGNLIYQLSLIHFLKGSIKVTSIIRDQLPSVNLLSVKLIQLHMVDLC